MTMTMMKMKMSEFMVVVLTLLPLIIITMMSNVAVHAESPAKKSVQDRESNEAVPATLLRHDTRYLQEGDSSNKTEAEKCIDQLEEDDQDAYDSFDDCIGGIDTVRGCADIDPAFTYQADCMEPVGCYYDTIKDEVKEGCESTKDLFDCGDDEVDCEEAIKPSDGGNGGGGGDDDGVTPPGNSSPSTFGIQNVIITVGFASISSTCVALMV